MLSERLRSPNPWPAIRTRGVSKSYHIYNNPRDRLKQILFGKWKTYYREFWALENIDLEIQRGEAVGIIGRNGSGKSTLLQLICGTLAPTRGEVNVNGRISALLELGSGFNMEFTGRENVFINAAILGLSRPQILERFDAIAAFADIGEFLDRPVKTYSTGMLVRLAFAVQVGIDPDILIVDEALSVGDIFFQQKCMRRMRQLREKGVTILFVSHDLAMVRDFCDNALYLANGKSAFYGPSHLAIQQYRQTGFGSASAPHPTKLISLKREDKKCDIYQQAIWQQAIWKRLAEHDPVEAAGNGALLLAVAVSDENGNSSLSAAIGSALRFRILYQAMVPEKFHVAIVLKNRYDQVVFSGGTYTLGMEPPELSDSEMALLEFGVKLMLEAGPYSFSIRIGKSNQSVNSGVVIDRTPWLGPLSVTWDYENFVPPFFGLFGLPLSGRFISLK